MEESIASIESSIILSNKSAVENLRKEKYDHAIFFLNQALLTAKGMKDSDVKANLLSMTYNNLGCYLKRLNKLPQALEYFKKSSDLSNKYESSIANVTCSHLNISKIYSEQGNHELALRHGLKSLFLLRHNFATKHNLVSSLIIAYQTVGIEYKYLNQLTDCVECFETGLNLSLKQLGKNHEVTLALKKSLQEVSGRPEKRSQSNQSKKIENPRGRSAKLNKIPSKTSEGSSIQGVRTRENILRRVGRREIKAAIFIQQWWKKKFWVLKRRKREAALVIQRWWKGIIRRRMMRKSRTREVKRTIVKKIRSQGVKEAETRNMINEKEQKLMNGSSKILEEIKRSENKRKEMKKSENLDEREEFRQKLKELNEKKSDRGKTADGVKGRNKVGDPVKQLGNSFEKPPRHETPKRIRVQEPKVPEKQVHKSTESIKENNKPEDLLKQVKEINIENTDKIVENQEKMQNDNKNNNKIVEHQEGMQNDIKNTNEIVEHRGKIQATEEKLKKIQSDLREDSQQSPEKPKNVKKNFLQGRRADITHQINSLIKIQSFMRMVPVKLLYKKLKKSAIKIQSVYRAHLIRKLYQAIRDAVLFIQYMYRKYKNKL